MKLTVSQAIVKCLENEGIEYSFGITGSHYLAFFDALKDTKIKYISVNHENAAGFMTLNYTKIAQKPALVMATAGPGAMNLCNGVAEMYKCNIPGFVLTPLIPTVSFGKNVVQEDTGYGTSYSVNKILQNITKKSIMAVRADRVQDHVRQLLRIALTPPYGPVHIAVPTDLFSEDIEFTDLKPHQYRLVNDTRIELKKIEKAASSILHSKKPLLLLGNRCLYPDCSNEMEKLVNSFKIPFVLTHASKGILDENHKLFGGVLDLFGHRSAEKLVKNSDLILAFGMDFSEAETIKFDPDLFKKAKIISFDSNDKQIGVNYPIEFGIAGNLAAIIDVLCRELKKLDYKSSYNPTKFNEEFLKLNTKQIKEMTTITDPMKVPFIFNEISKLMDKNSMVFLDQGAIGFASVRHFISKKKGYFTSPTGYSMAQGVAGCVGGKIACPGKNAFSITGDGAFLMLGNEVLTAVQYKLGVTWIIFKDDLYNMIQINQCLVYNGRIEYCAKIQNPDFYHLAKAYGAEYFEVKTKEDLISGINQAKKINAKNKPVLIIIHYDHREHLPIKPRSIQIMKDYGQTKDIKSNPYMMRAFRKVLDEKV